MYKARRSDAFSNYETILSYTPEPTLIACLARPRSHADGPTATKWSQSRSGSECLLTVVAPRGCPLYDDPFCPLELTLSSSHLPRDLGIKLALDIGAHVAQDDALRARLEHSAYCLRACIEGRLQQCVGRADRPHLDTQHHLGSPVVQDQAKCQPTDLHAACRCHRRHGRRRHLGLWGGRGEIGRSTVNLSRLGIKSRSDQIEIEIGSDRLAIKSRQLGAFLRSSRKAARIRGDEEDSPRRGPWSAARGSHRHRGRPRGRQVRSAIEIGIKIGY